jgi:hypothetical protein
MNFGGMDRKGLIKDWIDSGRSRKGERDGEEV